MSSKTPNSHVKTTNEGQDLSEVTCSNKFSESSKEVSVDGTSSTSSGEKRTAPVISSINIPADVNRLRSKRTRSTKEDSTIDSNVFDGAFVYGLNPGDRLQVKWDIIENEGTDNECTVEHWWGATLVEYDGRTYVADENDDDHRANEEGENNDVPNNDNSNTIDDSPIAIHVLEYDAYPEGGFPEKSREDVIFVNAFELVDVNSQDIMEYKRDGDDGMVSLCANDENGNGFEGIVNTVLMNAMNKSFGSSFDKLPAATQLHIAEKIASKKAKLVQLMDEFFATSGKRIGTSKDMKELIEKTMQGE